MISTIHDDAKAIMNDPRVKSDDCSERVDCVFINWDLITLISRCADVKPASYYFDDLFRETILRYAQEFMDDIAIFEALGYSKQLIMELNSVIKWCEHK